MNISTLAKLLGVSIGELRETGAKNSIYGFYGRNTRIPYNSAAAITKILKPDKLNKLENDDKIYLPNSINVSEFAETIGKTASQVVKTLLLNGVIATLNEKIDYDTASLIAQELGVEVFPENPEMFENSGPTNVSMIRTVEYDTPENEKTYVERPPVVTVMGHVDHGKTTLLDTIRKANVVATEAGAITQHISSYQITYKDKKITFIDTPGHEAFTAMRARGSQLADFIILMVSAVEGPKPQTIEVVERAKLTKTPVIVALNKIDLPDSDPSRVKQEMTKYGLVAEEWGGDTPFIEISAKNNLNIDKLLDTVLLHAELADLKGEINCLGQAVIIESHLDQNLGVVATTMVVKDKIKVGDVIACGELTGKIRKLESSEGKNLTEAGLCEPVVLIGLPQVVEIGEAIIVYPNQKAAQNAANLTYIKKSQKKVINHNFTTQDNQVNLILKADVSGSLEALKESIIKIPQEKVQITIKSESVGHVNEGDVEFAQTTNSAILAFHTDFGPKVETMAKQYKITVFQSDIIYELLQWVEEQILANTKHEVKTVVLGQAKILAIFKSEKSSIQVGGGEVIMGKILSSKQVNLIRNGENLGKLEIVELQRNKVKATEVNISQQFGVSLTGKAKMQIGDILESVDEILVK